MSCAVLAHLWLKLVVKHVVSLTHACCLSSVCRRADSDGVRRPSASPCWVAEPPERWWCTVAVQQVSGPHRHCSPVLVTVFWCCPSSTGQAPSKTDSFFMWAQPQPQQARCTFCAGSVVVSLLLLFSSAQRTTAVLHCCSWCTDAAALEIHRPASAGAKFGSRPH